MNSAFIVQSASVGISAIGVISTIIWNRVVARRRATLDLLLADQTNEHLLEIRRKYLQSVKDNKLLEYSTRDQWFSVDATPYVSTLNRYELIAVGINEGALDERIYKRFWRTTFVNDWLRCRDAVRLQRSNFKNDKMFIEFESVARRWAYPDELAKFDLTSS
jgi:hypothetical protein